MLKTIGIGPYTEDGEMSIKELRVDHSNEKVASALGKHIPSEILAFKKIAKSSPDHVFLHVIAMTASDFYGPNRNGDWFSESELTGMQSPEESKRNLSPQENTPVERYKTFLQASFYHHHRNKPHLGHPRFGRVVVAAYNYVMHRVELVIQIFSKDITIDGINYLGDPETCLKVRNGCPIALSMGTKIPYDISSLDGKKHKSPSEYSSELRACLRQILPDGRKGYLINIKPRFFDISKVTIPADPQGYSLEKVANLGTVSNLETVSNPEGINVIPSAIEAQKYLIKESFNKKSQMEKEVPGGKTIGEIPGNGYDVESEPYDIPENIINHMSNYPIGSSVAQALSSGIILKKPELGRIIAIRMTKIPANEVIKESSKIDWNSGVDYDLAKEFKKIAKQRSCFKFNRNLEKKAAYAVEAGRFKQRIAPDVTLGDILELIYKTYKESIRTGTMDQFFELLNRNPYLLPLTGTIDSNIIFREMKKTAGVGKEIRKAVPFFVS